MKNPDIKMSLMRINALPLILFWHVCLFHILSLTGQDERTKTIFLPILRPLRDVSLRYE